jgi:DNA-binding response OmpR family regulator
MNKQGRKVLIIDDVLEMEAFLSLLLSRERNDQVTFVDSGAKGLAAAQQDPPHLIILDLAMPDLDGYQVLRQLKTTPALQTVPVLVISALGLYDAGRQVRQLGIKGYLSKPFGLQELLAARDAVLRGEAFYHF